jgi:hypothetical protein
MKGDLRETPFLPLLSDNGDKEGLTETESSMHNEIRYEMQRSITGHKSPANPRFILVTICHELLMLR